VKSVGGNEIVYGEHVLEKMRGWVEFQDAVDEVSGMANAERMAVEAY